MRWKDCLTPPVEFCDVLCYPACDMKCPYCSNPLLPVVSKSAVLDICPVCRGIWFDSGEFLDFVRRLSQNEKIAPAAVELFKKREVVRPFEVHQKDKICPKCGKKLKTFNYSYDSNIFLDKCPDCGGIWADKDEAMGIASYLKDNPKATAVGKSIIEILEQPDEVESAGLGFFLFFPRLIIPLYDDVPRERFPFITISLIVMCVVSFLWTVFSVTEPEGFLARYGFIPARFLGVGIITSMFLHSGIFHLVFNMLYLWLFGDNVEDRFSRAGYFLFYIMCGIAAALLHTLFNWNSTVPTIGASGAVAGMMGAYLVFYPSATLEIFAFTRTFNISVVTFLGLWFLGQLTFGLMDKSKVTSNVAYLAHVGGFAFGAAVAFIKKMQSRGKDCKNITAGQC